MLINAQTSAPGWIEWFYQKRNVSHLRNHGVTQVSVWKFFFLPSVLMVLSSNPAKEENGGRIAVKLLIRTSRKP